LIKANNGIRMFKKRYVEIEKHQINTEEQDIRENSSGSHFL